MILRMKLLISFGLLAVCLLALSVYAKSPRGVPAKSDPTQAKLLASIARKDISRDKLLKATSQLKLPATESPQFWSRIANASGYPELHRVCAVFQLVSRHVHKGMQLSELARILDHPTWLRASDLGVVNMGGKVPIHREDPMKDEVFCLYVLQPAGKDEIEHGEVFLAVGMSEPA